MGVVVSNPFRIQINAATPTPVVGPIALFQEIHQVPGGPFVLNGYCGIGPSSKHNSMAKVGSYWYHVCGDFSSEGAFDPTHLAINGNIDQSNDGRQETFRFDPTDDDSWRCVGGYYRLAAETPVQAFNRDDAFAAGDGTEIFSWKSTGVYFGDPQQPGAPYATLVKRPTAFNPVTGVYRDLGVNDESEYLGNNAWHAIYYAAGGVFIIPCADSKLLIKRKSDWADISVRSGGNLFNLTVPGVVSTSRWYKTGGFVAGSTLYLWDHTNHRLCSVDLTALLAWTSGSPPAGLVTNVGPIPETASYASGSVGGGLVYDATNDLIFVYGSRTFVRARTGDVNTWQTVPRLDSYDVPYTSSGNVSASDSWVSEQAYPNPNAPSFLVTITGTWVGTVTIQKSFNGGNSWADVTSFTSNTSNTSVTNDPGAAYRIGFKAGQYTSGTASCAMAHARQVGTQRVYHDSTVGGMLSIGAIDFDTGRRSYRYTIVKANAEPGWIPSAGNVASLSGSSFLADVAPGAGVWYLNGNIERTLIAWNSGVMAPDYGALGALIVAGAGDADSALNCAFAFPFDTRTWVKVGTQSGPSAMDGTTSATDPLFNGTWGEHGDGQPAMPHTYDQLEYLPKHSTGGTKGSLVLCTKYVAYRIGHFSSAHALNLDTGAWRRASSGNSSMVTSVDSPSWCWHPTYRRFYGFVSGASPVFTDRIHYLDFQNKGGVGVYNAIGVSNHLMLSYATSRYWPRRDRIVIVGNDATQFAVRIWDPYNAGTPTAVTITGDIPVGNGFGFDYVPELDCFFVRSPAAGYEQVLWKLTPDPVNPETRPWVSQQITMGGATVTGNTPNGMWKRFSYNAKIKCLVWVSSSAGAVYGYRPVGV